jgi:anthraniloyl-CoA monooxygenase
VSYDSLRARDPKLVAGVDRWFAEQAAHQSGVAVPAAPAAPPPMFTPFRLREVVLPNRVVAPPMCREAAEDGTPGDRQLTQLGRWAEGGAGLVIAEMTAVSREGRIGPGSTGLYRPDHVAAWRRIVEVVHGFGAARVGIQLGHAGRKGATHGWARTAEPLGAGDWPLVSASPLRYVAHGRVPRELDRRDMDAVRDAFVQATHMAAEAGFDLLELQLGHGFLLASFLSPLTNHRTDEYGGPLTRRLRFPLEVLGAVRAAWPAERPLGARISATDWCEGGLAPVEAVEIARALKGHGCDLVDVSAGGTVVGESPSSGRLFQTPFSDRIRHEADIATMTSGGLTSHGDVNSILAAGRADLCALGQAHLENPDWTRQAARAQSVIKI